MTTLAQISLSCPVCNEQFQSQKVTTTNSFGGKRTDFHERAAGTQPLPFFVHVCQGCGFAGPEQLFDPSNREALTPEVCDQLREALGIFVRPDSAFLKYEAAARTAEILGDDARVVGDLYLRAAWCCVDEYDTEAERFYRLKAVRAFMDSLSAFDGVPRDERAVVTYLTGELWRRIGHDANARFWFDAVEAELVDRTTQGWIVDLARQQRDRPREWFGQGVV